MIVLILCSEHSSKMFWIVRHNNPHLLVQMDLFTPAMREILGRGSKIGYNIYEDQVSQLKYYNQIQFTHN